MENIRQGAPAAVSRQRCFFSIPGLSAFVFDQPESADRCDIVASLFLQTALPDPVSLRYPEVPRRPRGRFRLDVAGFDNADDGLAVGGRSSLSFPLWGNAHSSRASSHADW